MISWAPAPPEPRWKQRGFSLHHADGRTVGRMAHVIDVSQPKPWWQEKTLWLLLLLAAILRLILLGHKSLWLDEAATYTLSTSSLHAFGREWWAREANATAYYMFERVWLNLGRSEWMLRFPSALFGIGAVGAVYAFTRRTFGEPTAWLAALLLAVHPAHIELSQDARSYTMAMFFAVLSCYWLVRAMEDGGWRNWTAYALLSALAVYSHYFAALVLIAQTVSLIAVPRAKLRWRPLLLAAVGILLLCAPALVFLVLQGRTVTTAWIAPVSPKQLFRLLQFYSGSGLKFILMALLWAAAVWHIVRRPKNSSERWHIALLLSWVIVPILLAYVVSLRQSVFAFKYLMVSLPAVLILAANGAASLPRSARWIVVSTLAVASCVTVVAAYRKPIEDWRDVSAFVEQNFQPGDAIAFSPPYARNAFDYYWDRTGNGGLKILAPKPLVGQLEDDAKAEADPAALLAACKECRRVWLVEYGTDAPPPGARERTQAIIQAMPHEDRLRLSRDFRNLRLSLYAP